MNILGIADNHDSGAALLCDGKLAAAVNQERIDRNKNSSAFPWGAVDAVLEKAKKSPQDIDVVVVGTSYTPSAVLRLFPHVHQNQKQHGQFSSALHAYMVYQSVLKRTKLDAIEIAFCRRILKRKMRERRLSHASLKLLDHHQAHAEAAYRTQQHHHCLVLTLDAMGDGCTASVSIGKEGILRRVWDQSGLAGINLFYSRITELLGFRPLRHEGKITGLSARENPDPVLLSLFRKEIAFRKGKFRRMSIIRSARLDDEIWRETAKRSREVVAATAQKVFEEAACAFVEHWVQKTGISCIALAGGAFANVRVNQLIAEISCVKDLWVLPHMGDGGLAVGAAMSYAQISPSQIEHVYWGNTHQKIDLLRAKQRHQHKVHPNAVQKAADILCSGGIIARSSGGMEWGPRALGNRSIFALAQDPSINERLNQKLNRSEFMPFAPIIREEDAKRFFVNPQQYGSSLYFMTCCANATEEFQRVAPAVVHIDGTARPQLVRATIQPELHALLGEIELRTGAGVLINTSFNLHEEPIVCTPDESIRAAKAAQLDGLWLEDQLLTFG